MKNIVVIGAGPAGMMAAIIAARDPKNSVTILERNNICGMKLNITGKGRCNVTNDCDVETLLRNTPRNGKFLNSAYNNFTPADTKAFFELLGVALKTERGERVFPVSDRAKDISGALRTCIEHENIKLVQTRARRILVKNGKICGVAGGNDRVYDADSVILATGGMSYPKTGSSGDGYAIVKQFDHTTTDLVGSLVSLKAEGDDPEKLEGLSLKNIGVTFVNGKGKKLYSDFGEMVFTSDGVSGPVILSASSHICRLVGAGDITLSIDLKPALERATLDKRLLRDFEENLNRDFANSLSALLPSKLIPVIIERSGILPTKKVNSITKEERAALIEAMKVFTLKIRATGSIDEAIVTSGGISVREIDPKTMQSKLLPGLFFAGEVIDVDAYTGGFNLQIAWSTGFAAGMAQHEI